MKTIKRVTTLVTFLLITASIAYGQQITPPPEAYKACEGKSVGSAAQVVDQRGETVKGTCVEKDGKLFLRPDRSKGDPNGMSGNRPGL